MTVKKQFGEVAGSEAVVAHVEVDLLPLEDPMGAHHIVSWCLRHPSEGLGGGPTLKPKGIGQMRCWHTRGGSKRRAELKHERHF